MQVNERIVIGRPLGTTEWIRLTEERDYQTGKLLGYRYNTNSEELRANAIIRLGIDQIELRKFPDWMEVRREMATSFVNSILSNPAWHKRFSGHCKEAQFDNAYFKEWVVGNALSYADYLIEKLNSM